MFKITPNPTFTTDVKLHVPGEIEPGSVRVTFKYLTPEELIQWQKDFGKKAHAEALGQIISAWNGVEDKDGKPVEYSKENLNALLNKYHVAGNEFIQAYVRELLGSRTKN